MADDGGTHTVVIQQGSLESCCGGAQRRGLSPDTVESGINQGPEVTCGKGKAVMQRGKVLKAGMGSHGLLATPIEAKPPWTSNME